MPRRRRVTRLPSNSLPYRLSLALAATPPTPTPSAFPAGFPPTSWHRREAASGRHDIPPLSADCYGRISGSDGCSDLSATRRGSATSSCSISSIGTSSSSSRSSSCSGPSSSPAPASAAAGAVAVADASTRMHRDFPAGYSVEAGVPLHVTGDARASYRDAPGSYGPDRHAEGGGGGGSCGVKLDVVGGDAYSEVKPDSSASFSHVATHQQHYYESGAQLTPPYDFITATSSAVNLAAAADAAGVEAQYRASYPTNCAAANSGTIHYSGTIHDSGSGYGPEALARLHTNVFVDGVTPQPPLTAATQSHCLSPVRCETSQLPVSFSPAEIGLNTPPRSGDMPLVSALWPAPCPPVSVTGNSFGLSAAAGSRPWFSPQVPPPTVGMAASPWTCEQGHEMCSQFGIHQCACGSTALASEFVHDYPQPVPQPCFGAREEMLIISGSFPCLHFRFANLNPWLYYSICIEFVSINEIVANYRSPVTVPIRFLPPGNHMPGHLWMSRTWGLNLEQIVATRLQHLPCGEFTPVVRLFATRGQLAQGQAFKGHPSDMIEASHCWFFREHSFARRPWTRHHQPLLMPIRMPVMRSWTADFAGHSNIRPRSNPALFDGSDGFSLSSSSSPSLVDSQSPPPCPREPWLDAEPQPFGSDSAGGWNVWGPPIFDSGLLSSNNPKPERILNDFFPEGFFKEVAAHESMAGL